MPVVYLKDNESFDILMKRFKKKCERATILADIKKHHKYEKPSIQKRKNENSAKRKMLKKQRKNNAMSSRRKGF